MSAYPTTTEHHKVYPYTSIMASPYFGDPTGTISCSAALESIKANQSNTGTISIPKGIFKISTNVTIPIGMKLQFESGSSFSVDAGKMLTIQCPVVSYGPENHFSGAGSVSIGTTFSASSSELIPPVTTIAITVNTTIPSNINLKVGRGTIFSIATGVTLTINGTLDTGLYQIFSCIGTGKVVFGTKQKTSYSEWFGALGDGTTDDYAALSKAGTCLSDGMTLSFRSGATYMSSDVLSVGDSKNNITVQGNGATISYTKAAVIGAWYFQLGNWTDTTQYTGCRVYDLTLTLNRAPTFVSGVGGSGMLAVKYCDDVIVRGCKVLRADVQGVYVGYGSRALIDGNLVGSKTMGSADAIKGDGIFTSNYNKLSITNNYVGNTNDDGIFHQVQLGTPRDTDITVTGNTVVCPDTHYGGGIRVQSADRVIIDSNKVYNTGDVGIDASEESPTWLGCVNYSITNNLIVNAGQSPGATGTNRDGINASGSYKGLISGNNIINPKRIGILVSRGMLTVAEAIGVIISGNNVECDADGGNNTTSGCGVQVRSYNRATVCNNTIFNPGAYGVVLVNDTADDMADIVVTDNNILNSRKAGEAITNGVVELYKTSTGIINAIIDRNTMIENRTPLNIWYAVQADAGQKVSLGASNMTNLLYNLPATSVSLMGTFTCANNKDTVVSNTLVKSTSTILLQPTNAAAAVLQGAATCLYISARVADTSFTVTTGNAAAAAGTETFNYRIIN